VELSPENAMFRATYGYFLTQTGQTDEARRQLEQALRLDPNSVWVHANLAWFYCMGGKRVADPDKALHHSGRALELAGPNPPENVLNTRAEALSLAGKYDEAMALNAQLKAMFPANRYYETQRKRFESNWHFDEDQRQAVEERRAREQDGAKPPQP
jgi:Flp pilus assembly protein TadD